MRTIERNYRKNPHTASFLQTFHTAIGSNGRNYRAEMVQDDADALTLEAGQDDLLDLVPETAPAFTQSAAQSALILKLTVELAELDTDLAMKAAEYNADMQINEAWTRENTSRWISNLIAKIRELRTAARKTTAPAAPVQVADGRYAVEEDGVLRFFKVKNGNRPGFVFLDVQASDDWHSIRNVTRIRAILALIAADPEEASLRYGRELGICGDCGRTLTDQTSRARGRGPVCDARH